MERSAKARLRPATEKESSSALVHTRATSSRLWASDERVAAKPSTLGIHTAASAVRESSTASKPASGGIAPSCEKQLNHALSMWAAMKMPPSSWHLAPVSGSVLRHASARMRHSSSTISSSAVTTGWSPKASGSLTRFIIAA